MPAASSAIDAHLPAVDPAEILDFARRDLEHAVSVALSRDGGLLTAGEGLVARALLALPEEAMSLYARLYGRRDRVFWLHELSYAEIADLPSAAAALVEAGLAWSAERIAPARLLAEASTVADLKIAAAKLGRSTKGLRAELVARLGDPDARPALVRPGLLLRHRGLFRRLCRLYLHDHEGDLSRFVVARLGLLRPPDYAPTGGEGLFPLRRDLLTYEAALARSMSSEDWTEADLLREGALALVAVEGAAPAPDWRGRFAARRWDERVAFAAGRLLERLGQDVEAEDCYARLLAARPRHAAEIALRRALCLDRLGRPGEGAACCRGGLPEADADQTVALQRTGRRLARKAGLPWPSPPPLIPAPERRISLPRGEAVGRRPGWGAGDARTVEAALVDWLAGRGRRAFHGENDLWTTLAGLLLRDALFAPVPGMLPTPLLSAPLDLGTPGFFGRRASILEDLLARVAAGEGPRLLAEAVSSSLGLAIVGVRWDLFTPETILEVCAALPPDALAAVLRVFAEDWRGATGGLPDLCLLPGEELALDADQRLPGGLRLVEVKGPTDALRDGQRVWHDRLLRAGLPVEVWWVEAS